MFSRKTLRLINKTAGSYFISVLFYIKKFVEYFRLSERKKVSASSVSNILIIKLVGLGDTVLMLPSIRKLKDVYPRATITALLTPLSSGILNNQAILDDIIIYDILGTQKGIPGFYKVVSELRKREFDLIIDYEQHLKLVTILSFLAGTDRIIGFDNPVINRGRLLTDSILLDGNKHMLESFNKLLIPLEIDFKSEKPAIIEVPAKNRDFIDKWLKDRHISDETVLVGIHVGSGKTALSRRWPKDRFAQIGDLLVEKYSATVILTGSSDELPLVRETASLMNALPVIAAGDISVSDLIALVQRFDLFISNDTGPMHIAPTVETPTIGLFGPDSPLRYGPFGSGHAAIYKKIDCSPCIDVHYGKSPDCDNPKCMKNITVDDVWQGVEIIMERIKNPA